MTPDSACAANSLFIRIDLSDQIRLTVTMVMYALAVYSAEQNYTTIFNFQEHEHFLCTKHNRARPSPKRAIRWL